MYCNSQEDTEDLFQEILLQLWRSYPNFSGASAVSTWMYRVALNTAITRLRKENNPRQALQFTHIAPDLPEAEVARGEQEQELYGAIARLNKFDKALAMLYLEEKSYQEMAEILGLSVTNVGAKINRIKHKLKQILNP